ncbi:ferritin-like domain-containing protein [Caldimonas tepidiphila]|uniref:ferritin-like domain-containing protein n=1 Tax=Caldimonas tepidiphila TaxID=2315841 RepID=UPI000E5B8661|nr:PA2169 family four-helix-bundle protein [Caldimonas tepidiphila]
MDQNDVLDTLNTLIETCKDGEYGFQQCAEHVKSTDLRTLFNDRAESCRRGAQELQSLVTQYGGTPDTGSSASGTLHRGWVSVKGMLTGHSDEAMLEECERGEDAALERYRNALAKPLPEPVRAVVERQYQGVQRNHDMVKAARNRIKMASS